MFAHKYHLVYYLPLKFHSYVSVTFGEFIYREAKTGEKRRHRQRQSECCEEKLLNKKKIKLNYVGS